MLDYLPQQFLARMRALLGEEYDLFIESYHQARVYGLRVNTVKVDVPHFLRIAPFTLKQIPWVEEGFYYAEAERPGKHAYHAAGLYYIQEPSAMAVVPILNPQPGDRVLDLAAAPGGKATQLAAALQGQGLLVANEIHPARARVLSENVERCGIRNALVTNETPQQLAKHFPEFFDRILLDAPCSGEGMFRKDLEACQEWKEDAPTFCAQRQWEVIVEAEKMLRPGGCLIYSTCTFAPEENEQLIARFLNIYPDMKLLPIPVDYGFKPAVRAWAGGNKNIEGAIRIWPQYVQGEGHFVALLQKNGKAKQQPPTPRQNRAKPDPRLKDYLAFAEQYLRTLPQGYFNFFGDHLYLLPPEVISLQGLKVIRPGWHLGTFYKGRFEPSHALALSFMPGDAKYTANYTASSPEVEKYLRGETLPREGVKGWTLVTVDGFSIGWGKQSEGMLKNHYPKGLRWLK